MKCLFKKEISLIVVLTLGRCMVIAIGLVLSLLVAGQPFAQTGGAAQNASEGVNLVGDLVGEWQWRCCSGQYSGKWRIDQKPDGTFSGRFLETSPHDIGTFEGRLAAGKVEFTRTFTEGGKRYEQKWWSVSLEVDGDTLKMKGNWSEAFDSIHTLEFSAEKISRAANPRTGTASGANDREKP